MDAGRYALSKCRVRLESARLVDFGVAPHGLRTKSGCCNESAAAIVVLVRAGNRATLTRSCTEDMKQFSTLPMLLFLLLSACSPGLLDMTADDNRAQVDATVPPRDAAAAFQTDQLSYTLSSTRSGLEGKITFVFTNPTSAPVYIVNCRGATSLRLEKQSGDTWVPAWSPVIPLCLSAPVVVQPGQQYSGVVHVSAGHPSNNLYPKFVLDPVPGVYRIVWADVLRTYDDQAYPFGEPLPLEQRVSNRFQLHVAPR